MIDIQNKNYEPTLDEINNYLEGKAKIRWLTLLTFINDNFKPKTQINYSRCSSMPGWNVKCRSKSKAICTLYPRGDYFAILLVLNQDDMEWFKGIKESCSKHVVERYENSGMMNGTKWVMIDITSDEILDDIKKMIKLKLER